MKKIIAIILTLVVALSLCACTSTPKEPTPAQPFESNALYVDVGHKITINGREFTSKEINFNVVGNEASMGTFLINRVTGEVFIYANYNSEAIGMPTGLYWTEDTIEIDGHVVYMLFDQNAE